MKTTTIEFFREIKKSSGRFVSILFIVALGVAFFSGIRASEPDMRVTGDAYFDQANLMDIKVISTLGLTKDDVKAFEGLDSIEKAEGAYSGDFLNYDGEKQRALHVMSLSEDMNQITVTEGRLPEKSGECLADDESTYKVGDKIKLTSGTEDPVTDTLTTDELTVVGTGNSPYYICLLYTSVPLVEIVSEPDMRSADEVMAYLEKLRLIIQYLGASDCKLQEGSMRADVNLSVREVGASEFGTRTEMKNLNSFKAIARAIDGERQRQIDLIEAGRAVVQETRRWDCLLYTS